MGDSYSSPVGPSWDTSPRNLTWNLKMMVSQEELTFSRDFFSGSMLNFGGVHLGYI